MILRWEVAAPLFEDALYGPQSADPVNGYRAYMEVDSYIDWYIVEELVKNHDTEEVEA